MGKRDRVFGIIKHGDRGFSGQRDNRALFEMNHDRPSPIVVKEWLKKEDAV